MVEAEVNVEFENAKVKGRFGRATGGTWALIGKLIFGAAVVVCNMLRMAGSQRIASGSSLRIASVVWTVNVENLESVLSSFGMIPPLLVVAGVAMATGNFALESHHRRKYSLEQRLRAVNQTGNE